MAQPLDVKRLLATGKQISEAGRQIRTDLVEQGRHATDQISAVVEQLVNPVGRDRIEDLRETVRDEVQQPLRTLGSEIREHLAAQGQLVGDRIAAAVEDLRDAVRDEIQRQVSTLGLATKDDLVALRRAIRDDLATREAQESAAAPATTPARPGDTHTPSRAGDDTTRQTAVQVTPPHQRPAVGDPSTP